MRFFRPLVTTFALVSTLHGVAWACSCMSRSLEEYADDAELVVRGTVVSVVPPELVEGQADDQLDAMDDHFATAP